MISVKIFGGLYSSTKFCYVTEGHSENKTQKRRDVNTVLGSNTGGLNELRFLTKWGLCVLS